jgi:hypothetical protein
VTTIGMQPSLRHSLLLVPHPFRWRVSRLAGTISGSSWPRPAETGVEAEPKVGPEDATR